MAAILLALEIQHCLLWCHAPALNYMSLRKARKKGGGGRKKGRNKKRMEKYKLYRTELLLSSPLNISDGCSGSCPTRF